MTSTTVSKSVFAHSPAYDGGPCDLYPRHVIDTRSGTMDRAEAMLIYATKPMPDLLDALYAGATFHDLGKLDPIMQSVFPRGRKARPERPHDHIDAGVAHLSSLQEWMGAWLIRAHHSPGLPQNSEHFTEKTDRRLRGLRRDDKAMQLHEEQIARTNAALPQYLSDHEAGLGPCKINSKRPMHGLTMRLALSCLVDADHADSAFFDSGRLPSKPVEPRWEERLESLCKYVRGLSVGETRAEQQRNRLRSDFFEACLTSTIDSPMVACEGPVGLGKTTAVAAYLIRRALNETPNLRRLIIVAPFTNILSQTADRLRKALVLPGERADEVIVEHHHRADFSERTNRELAVLWQAPVVLTTAVSFFETLAGCGPASLRKLHSLPGSAVFIDEAHAAIPTKLWPQNWRWLEELANQWRCRFVFASGSLARFWENAGIIETPVKLPELLPVAQAKNVLKAERRRITYERLGGGNAVTIDELISSVRSAHGPRLVILNTVQNAALVAKAMRKARIKVLHLSTALCPGDRECVLARVARWLEAGWKNWTLVATSCVEAGVDISFRTAFRERFGVASIIQVGGRVNRHGEYDHCGGGIVYDFSLTGDGVTQHPSAKVSAVVLRDVLVSGALNRDAPADVVTAAMREELRRLPLEESHKQLLKAEKDKDYPAVAKLGRVIAAETRLVVVDPKLRKRLLKRQRVSFKSLLRGSVQLWADKIEKLGLEPLAGQVEMFVWKDAYDADFLGIMAGILRSDRFVIEGGAVI